MTSNTLTSSNVLDRLLDAVKSHAHETALIFKVRGQWQSLTWSAAVAHADRAAAGLAKLGLRHGDRIVFDGVLTPQILIAAAAARAIGASVAAVNPAATPEERDAIFSDPSVRLVVSQQRAADTRWQKLRQLRPSVSIIIDHGTPGARPADHGIVTFDDLLRLAPAAGWAGSTASAGSRPGAPVVWVQETTAWTRGIDVVLEHWITTGEALAFPESLAAAARDRAEINPTSWIASSRTVADAGLECLSRLPDTGFARLAVKNALAKGRAPWSYVVRRLLRGHFGFSRLGAIRVFPQASEATDPNAIHLFDALGLKIKTGAATSAAAVRPVPAPELPARAATAGAS